MAGSFRILFMLEDITSLSYVTPKTVWCPTNFRTQASCILVHQKTSKVRYKNKVGIFGHTPVHFPLLWHISDGQTASVVSIKIKKHGTQRRFFYHTIHHDPPWLIKWCICVFYSVVVGCSGHGCSEVTASAPRCPSVHMHLQGLHEQSPHTKYCLSDLSRGNGPNSRRQDPNLSPGMWSVLHSLRHKGGPTPSWKDQNEYLTVIGGNPLRPLVQHTIR